MFMVKLPMPPAGGHAQRMQEKAWRATPKLKHSEGIPA
jgi:hypothetical protein